MTIPSGSIPFNRSAACGRELEYVEQALQSGQIAGAQSFAVKCQELLERELGVSKALLTTSCTHALEMAALLLELQPGDEVIIPAFSFVSTANAFVLRGARPVFCDIRSDTLNIDETKLESLVTARTKAIVPVHYAGVGCEMDAILEIARRHGLAVVEDNAHGVFGKYRGRCLGTFGDLATLSFHETKNITCGEGGALLINNPRYEKRAEILRDKGTDRARFLRGEVERYTWVDVGSSYVMSDLLAAFLYGQLEMRASIQLNRQRIWKRYHAGLADWCVALDVGQPSVPLECEPSWHMYYLLLPSSEKRQRLIDHLRHRNILAVFHYQPLHLSPVGVRWGGREGQCPVTERMSESILRLPFYNSMTEEDQARVVAAILEFK